MAGETEIKKLLVKLGVSTVDAKAAVKELLDLFAAADKQSTAAFADQQRQQKLSISDSKVQISQKQVIAQEIKNATALEQKRMAVAQAETAELQKQLALLKLQGAEVRKTATTTSRPAAGPIPINYGGGPGYKIGNAVVAGIVPGINDKPRPTEAGSGRGNGYDAGAMSFLFPPPEAAEELEKIDTKVKKIGSSFRGGTTAATSLFSVMRGSGLRAVSRFVGMSETLGPILNKAFSAIALLGFIELLSQLPAMFEKLSGAITGWDEKAKHAYEEFINENRTAAKAVRDLQFAQIDMQKIGAKGQRALDLENSTLQEKIKLLEQAQGEAKKAAVGAEQELAKREATKKSNAFSPGTFFGLIDPLELASQYTQSKSELEKTRDDKEKEARDLDADIRKLKLDDAVRTAREVAEKEKELAKDLAKEQLELQKQLAEESYQAEATGIKESTESLDRAYKDREISLTEYVAQKKALNEQEVLIDAARQKRLDEAAYKELELDKETLGKKFKVREDELKSRTAVAFNKRTSDQRTKDAVEDDKLRQDQLTATQEVINSDEQLTETAIAQKRHVVEKAYKDELVTADQYYATLKILNEEDLDSKVAAENAKFALEEKTGATTVAHILKLAEIRQQYANEEVNLEAEKEDAIDEKRGVMFDRQRERLNKEQELYRQATQEQQKPGGIIAGMIGRFNRAGGVAQGLQMGLSGLQAIAGVTGGRNAGDVAGPLQEGFKYLFKDRTKLDQQGVEALKNFNSALMAGAEAVTSFLQALTQPRSGAAGGFAGGFATMGLGKTLAGSFPKQLSALGGPAGQLAELAGGAIIGAILGHARAEMERTVRRLQEGFTKVTKSIDDGGTKLTTGIQQLQAMRQQAVDELSGSKSGRQKLKDILPQMDDQIHALSNQLSKTVNDFNLAYAKLLNPEGMGSFIDSLDGILKQYKEFALAVDDTAKAQDYLNRSVQQYVNSQQRELNQNEMDAVNDALNYNDLLKQRKDLLDQIRTSQYDALTKGVLSRERTGAQQALAEQAAQAKQYADQIHQIDQQIALAKVKVDSEQQVFSLSTTRIGLETQLITLQKAQTTYDMQRIAELKTVVDLFQNGSSTAINSFLNAAGIAPDLRTLFENAFATYGRYGFASVQTQ